MISQREAALALFGFQHFLASNKINEKYCVCVEHRGHRV